MARLLTPEGELICQLDEIDLEGSAIESGGTFSAVIPDDVDGVVIRTGAALVEMDDGTRYPGEVGQAAVTTETCGAVVRITGVLVPIEQSR